MNKILISLLFMFTIIGCNRPRPYYVHKDGREYKIYKDTTLANKYYINDSTYINEKNILITEHK